VTTRIIESTPNKYDLAVHLRTDHTDTCGAKSVTELLHPDWTVAKLQALHAQIHTIKRGQP